MGNAFTRGTQTMRGIALNSHNSQLIGLFMNQPVVVATSLGPVTGVLAKAGKSRHGGIGLLLLQGLKGDWILVKAWTAIKRF